VIDEFAIYEGPKEEIIEKITGIVYLVMKIGQILLNEKIGIGIQQWGNQQMMH
jgi:hypothetical protein